MVQCPRFLLVHNKQTLLNYFIYYCTLLFRQVAEYSSNTDKKSVLTGGMATFDVYSFPDLNRNDQLSSSKISVAHSNSPEFNAVLAGWMVSFRPPVCKCN